MISLPTLPPHILFDWGNTLMVDDPARTDPMHLWPEVKTVPGAEFVVSRLAESHLLSIATNASPSRAADVRKALARVSLDDYFRHIFCAQDLGFQKQDPEFWKAVTDTLQVAPSEICMIGDSLETDIMPATRAGLMTVWFYPTNDNSVTMPHFTSIRTLREMLSQFQF
jgi:HAD superfamily hydrolase (TIGR01509 family)